MWLKNNSLNLKIHFTGSECRIWLVDTAFKIRIKIKIIFISQSLIKNTEKIKGNMESFSSGAFTKSVKSYYICSWWLCPLLINFPWFINVFWLHLDNGSVTNSELLTNCDWRFRKFHLDINQLFSICRLYYGFIWVIKASAFICLLTLCPLTASHLHQNAIRVHHVTKLQTRQWYLHFPGI